MKKIFKIAAMLGVAGLLALSTACTDDDYNNIAAGNAYEDIYSPLGDIGIESGPALLSPEDIEAFWASMFDPETVQIYVNGEAIEAATPFADGEVGTIMLPLVAIAEAMGYTVVDEGEEVIIAPGIMVTEGINSFARGREAAIELTSAPRTIDGVMFVPWEFFHEILSGWVMVDDGNVHVDTDI